MYRLKGTKNIASDNIEQSIDGNFKKGYTYLKWNTELNAESLNIIFIK